MADPAKALTIFRIALSFDRSNPNSKNHQKNLFLAKHFSL